MRRDGTVARAAHLNSGNRTEAAQAKNGAHCPHGSGGLAKQAVERERRGAGRNDDGLFPFTQGNGQAVTPLAYQSINDAIEQQFQRAGHIAPITGHTQNEKVAGGKLTQKRLRPIVRQHTGAPFATRHAACTRRYVKIIDADGCDLDTIAHLAAHSGQHGGDVSLGAGTGIDYEHFHHCGFTAGRKHG